MYQGHSSHIDLTSPAAPTDSPRPKKRVKAQVGPPFSGSTLASLGVARGPAPLDATVVLNRPMSTGSCVGC